MCDRVEFAFKHARIVAPAFDPLFILRSLLSEAAKRGQDPRSSNGFATREPIHAKIATGRGPTWARPLALFTSLRFGAPPEIVRLAWARSGARYSARISRARWPGGSCGSNRPPSCLTKCAFTGTQNSSATKVEMQAGNAPVTATKQATVRMAQGAGHRMVERPCRRRSARYRRRRDSAAQPRGRLRRS